MKSVSFLLAGALALAASQSFAEVANSSQPDWKAANNAFRNGAHGNFTPTTPQQKLQCAAYWLAWKSEIGTQMVPYVVVRGLDNGLGPDAAKAEIDGLLQGVDQSNANGQALVRAGDEAKTSFVVGTAGDTRAWHDFFAHLGACRVSGDGKG